MRGKLGAAQRRLLEYLLAYISETGHSPRAADIAEGAAVCEGNIGTMLRVLQIRDMLSIRRISLSIENNHTQMTRGTGYAVLAVRLSENEEMVWVRNPDSPFAEMATQRRCMCCTKFFLSRHKFNRLCEMCSTEAIDAAYGTFDSYGLGYVSNSAAILDGKIGGFRGTYA